MERKISSEFMEIFNKHKELCKIYGEPTFSYDVWEILEVEFGELRCNQYYKHIHDLLQVGGK